MSTQICSLVASTVPITFKAEEEEMHGEMRAKKEEAGGVLYNVVRPMSSHVSYKYST